jgi:hypothetical protein
MGSIKICIYDFIYFIYFGGTQKRTKMLSISNKENVLYIMYTVRCINFKIMILK